MDGKDFLNLTEILKTMDKQIIKKVLQQKGSLKSSQTNSISVYKGELTKRCIVEVNIIIQQAFPALSDGFFTQFNRMIVDFTDQRLRDSVDHVIRTCIYPTPTIASFLSYDNRIDLYLYFDIKKMCSTNYNAFEDYKYVESLDRYAHIKDIKQWDLNPT